MLATQVGDVELWIPKLRKGSYLPVILEPRRIDQAQYAVVMEAYVCGVSTRSVDDLVAALGVDYVYLDATHLHVRSQASQVVSMAVVVATGMNADGGREVLGLDVGDSEDEVFWRAFLTDLKKRGLGGVRLVISDQHAGLVAALKRSCQGPAHQRCRVHFARNLLALVRTSHTDMVAAVFRTIFPNPTPGPWRRPGTRSGTSWPSPSRRSGR